jgi:hypothetical protein
MSGHSFAGFMHFYGWEFVVVEEPRFCSAQKNGWTPPIAASSRFA